MARRKGQEFPSDHRRYFRVLEDILDSPKLTNVRPDVFRFYVRLLALLNRTKSRSGEITLTRQSLNFCAVREQRRHALSVAREGAAAGLFTMSERGLEVLICVPNWLKHQGFPPAESQRETEEAPAPNPVPIPTPIPTHTKSASDARAHSECLCPETLGARDMNRLASELEILPAKLSYGWKVLRDWSHSKNQKRTDWIAAFRNGIRIGWVFDGFGTSQSGSASASGVRRPVTDVMREARQKSIDADRRLGAHLPPTSKVA